MYYLHIEHYRFDILKVFQLSERDEIAKQLN